MRTYLVSVVIVTAGLWPGLASSSAASETLDRGAGSRSTAFVHCTIFSNQAEFEAFNEEAGATLTGVETFEESILPPGAIDQMDDPLCGGIPNPPDGFPFPNGLEQLNLCVQSNLLGGAPDVPAPSTSGTRAISAGVHGAVSDIVTSGTFVHSFDLLFTGAAHTGIGFDTLVLLGGDTAEIRVYGEQQNLLFDHAWLADPAGSNFFGVSCYERIERINIFDPDGGIEGADNIQMWVTPIVCGDDDCDSSEACDSCPADCGACPFCGDGTCDLNEDCLSCPGDCGQCPACIFFDNQVEFEAFNEEEGTIFTGVEDFEEGTLPPVSIGNVDDPLCGGIPSTPAGSPYPAGLTQLNICVQSNTLGASSATPSPAGADGLDAVSAGFLGITSDVVLSGFFVYSLDLMFGDPVPPEQQDEIAAVGFDTVAILGEGMVDVSLYDTSNVFMGIGSSPADPAGSNYFGVWCPVSIGRINIDDVGNGAEGADNIQLWATASMDPCGDCPTDVDGSGSTGASDLAVLLGSWGPCAPGDPCACLDANYDGVINAADLAVLLGSWGPCP